jgi:toxin ParE1/3/4
VKFTILSAAELEAAEAAAWYDDRVAGLGDQFLDELSEALISIRRDPQSFSRLETYQGAHEIRRRVLRRFSYLVVYLCRPEETLIVAICHARRKPLYWLDRLGK